MQTTRRSFLKGAAMGTVALGASSLATVAVADDAAPAAANTYKAAYRGCQGFVNVEAVIEGGVIKSLVADGPFETQGIGTYALELLPAKIVAANSVDVDAIAGATMTSTAILKAAAMAMVQAGMDAQTAPVAQAYKAGTYQAAYKGHMGPVNVSVTFSDNAITEIVLGDNTETPSLVNAAVENIFPYVVENQSLAVDAVATATYSARAILQGIADCVEQAGGDASELKRPVIDNPVKAADETMDVDVAVVGGGTSGSIAFYRLASSGVKTVCLEAAAAKGGMGEIAGFMSMLWYGSQLQMKELNLDEAWLANHVDEDVEFMYATAGQLADKRMLHSIAEGCGKMVDMFEAAGMPLTVNNETGVKIPIKGARWQFLHDRAAEFGGVTLLKHRVDEILVDQNGAVAGVKAQRVDGSYLTVNAKAVILASGGCSANMPLLLSDFPNATPFVQNCSISTVDGAPMQAAWAIGAEKADFGIHGHNHTMPLTAKIAGISTVEGTNPVASVGNTPLLWLDRAGNRYCDETACYKPTPGGNVLLFSRRCFNVFDQATVDKFVTEGTAFKPWRGIALGTPMPGLPEELEAGIANGYVFKADTIEELALQTGWDPQIAAAEVAHYNEIVAAGFDPEYHKPAANLVYTVEQPPFYAIDLRPRALGTFGGLKIDRFFGVVGENGRSIPGLYACGDNAAGWFGIKYPDMGGLTSFHNTTSGYVVANNVIDFLA